METRLEFIKKVPLFKGLEPEELVKIDQCIRPRLAKPGDILFNQGDPADGAYIIRSGQLDVEMVMPNLAIRPLTRLSPGRMVGELCLIDNAPRSMRVRVWLMSELLFLDRVLFEQLRKEEDPAAYKVVRNILLVLCGRLRTTNEKLQDGVSGIGAESENLLAPPPGEVPATTSAWNRLRSLLVGR